MKKAVVRRGCKCHDESYTPAHGFRNIFLDLGFSVVYGLGVCGLGFRVVEVFVALPKP